WGPLAAAGDARAQAGLGFMYYSGRGIARDSARAAEFFDRAADQGEPTAQLFLALMYFKADGVPKSSPIAMMWLELAIAGGQGDVYELRGTIMESMSEAEREEGWRLIARWRQTHRRPYPAYAREDVIADQSRLCFDSAHAFSGSSQSIPAVSASSPRTELTTAMSRGSGESLVARIMRS